MKNARFLCALLATITACGHADSAAVSPVEKVIQLMSNLVATLEAEAKAEAADYDKFACWCKNMADNKVYAIETSKKKQASLAANIEKLANQISKLDGEVEALDLDVAGLKGDKTTAKDNRAKDHETYNTNKADYELCIRNAEEAKADVHKKTHGVMDLQVRRLVEKGPIKADGSLEFDTGNLEDTIEKVKQMCMKKLQDTEENEYKHNSEHDLKVQAMDFKIKMKTKESKEKAALSESKAQEKEANTEEKEHEKENSEADDKFLKEDLTKQCKERAQEFHGRVEERNTEISKLTEAKEVVEEGVKPNYGANKKLVDLQKASSRPQSLLQLHRGKTREVFVQRARKMLIGSADRLHSTSLSNLVLKIGLVKNFDKIQSLITDLVERLEDEQADDNAKKAECDALFTEAEKRDNANAAIETQSADMLRAQNDIVRQKKTIATLNAEVAELQSALSENTEMTNTNKAHLEKDKSDAEEGKTAVENAIRILGGDGGEYDGNAGGDAILGMLNVICDDFKRTIDTCEDDLSDLEKAFNTFSTETETAVTGKTGLKDQAELDKDNAEGRLETATESKADEKGNLENALGQIKNLEPGCTDTQDYETRVKERKEEIEALKDAREILDGWKQ